MNDAQLLRYSRHILLDEWGIEVQQAVCNARVLIIGAGGLGCPAALYLVAAGIKQLTVIDGDDVDLTNLQRQIAHTTASVGQAKVDSLADTAARLNADVLFRAIRTPADDALLAREVPLADVVLDCTDHFGIRQAINRACVTHRVPLVSGAALRFDAQVTTFDLTDDHAPCYACVFPPEPAPVEASCATMGVFAPTVGIIGAIQAGEALKVLSGGMGETLSGRLLMLDSLSMRWNEFKVSRQPDCPVCGGHAGTARPHAI